VHKTLPVTNDVFTDPCPGLGKRLTVQARYGSNMSFADVSWSTGESDESIFVAPTESTTYTLEVSNDDLTCTDQVTIQVSDPQLALPYDTLSFCSIDSLLLQAPQGLQTYLWSDGQLGEEIYVSFSDVYSVTGFDEFGCQVSDSVLVSIVNASISTPDTIICIGDQATLVVNDNNYNLDPFYSNDFETSAGSEWSNSNRFSYDGSQCLGNFANELVSFSLNDLPPHESVVVSFTLYMIDSWDGNGSAGGESWIWTADGQNVLSTNFTSFESKSQCYPDNCPASNPWGTGSEGSIPGFCFPMDGFKYKVTKTIPHVDDAISMSFAASGLQGLCDESWAFDDFTVELVTPVSFNTIEWSTNETTGSIQVSPQQASWYFASISDGITTCIDSVFVQVSNPLPSFANDSLLICDLASFPIELEQEWNAYSWSSGESTSQINASGTGTYVVTITDYTPILMRVA
jgi:hypothetical protein